MVRSQMFIKLPVTDQQPFSDGQDKKGMNLDEFWLFQFQHRELKGYYFRIFINAPKHFRAKPLYI